jgi:hypothetical protein
MSWSYRVVQLCSQRFAPYRNCNNQILKHLTRCVELVHKSGAASVGAAVARADAASVGAAVTTVAGAAFVGAAVAG